MEQKWVKSFYKKQFEWFPYLHEYSEEYDEMAKEIASQVGKPFQSVLEIGAGNGNLARAIAVLGKEVTTVELVPELVEYAKQFKNENITSLCGSFYDIDLPETFDVLLYIDGFGVGEDSDQLFLLKRVYNWLKQDGMALIDIYNPNYWEKADGKSMYIDQSRKVLREYKYDKKNHRMLDVWWKEEMPEDTYTQSLACYSVEEIEKLCKEAGLKIIDIFPGGAMDWDEWKYYEKVSLEECLAYRIKAVRA